MSSHGAFRHAWFVIACVAAGTAMAQEKVPASKFFSMVKQKSVEQCEQSRAQANDASSPSNQLAGRMGVTVQCDCLPLEIDKLGRGADTPADLTQDEAMALIKPVMDLCGAKAFRLMLASGCPVDGKPEAGIKDQKAFCNCMSLGYEKLTDDQVTHEALAAHADFEARIAALREGRPPPPKFKGAGDVIEGACRAAQGAAPNP